MTAIIHTVVLFTFGLFALGGVGMYSANRRIDAATRRRRWKKFIVYIAIVYAVIFSALAGLFIWLAGVVVGIGLFEVLRISLRTRNKLVNVLRIVLAVLVYLLPAYGLLAFARSSSPETIVFVYLIVAVFDGFSQVIGQLWGMRRLAATISPGKTLEGSIGGLIAAVGVAWLLRALPGVSAFQAVFVGSLLSVAGLGGDLLASWYKRLNAI